MNSNSIVKRKPSRLKLTIIVLLCLLTAFFINDINNVNAETLSKIKVQMVEGGSFSISGNVKSKANDNDYSIYFVDEGEPITIRAIADDGYEFSRFILTTEDDSSYVEQIPLAEILNVDLNKGSMVLVCPSYNVKVSAVFDQIDNTDVVTDKDNEDTAEYSDDSNSDYGTDILSNSDGSSDSKQTTDNFNTDLLNVDNLTSSVYSIPLAGLSAKGIEAAALEEETVYPKLAVSILADKTSGTTLNPTTLRNEGTKQISAYVYPEKITYKIIIKNYSDKIAYNVKIVDTVTEQLKNSVNTNSINFNLQQGYYTVTDNGDYVFVSTSDNSSTVNDANNSNTTTEVSSGYTAGDLVKTLTFNKISAGESITLSLTMDPREDITRALNLKNSVEISGYYDVNDGIDTPILAQIPADSVLHNDSDTIHIGKYAIHYPAMKVDIKADKTTNANTFVDGVLTNTKVAGVYKSGDVVNYDVSISNIGDVTLHNITLNDVMSDALKDVISTASGDFSFDKNVIIEKTASDSVDTRETTESDATAAITAIATVSNYTTAVISSLDAGYTAHISFKVKIKDGTKESKQLSNKVTATALWQQSTGATTNLTQIDADDKNHIAEDFINIVGTPDLCVSILANKSSGVTLNNETLKYDGTKITGKYKACEEVSYQVYVKNTGETSLYNVSVTNVMTDALKKAMQDNVLQFVNSDESALGSSVISNSGKEIKITKVSSDNISLEELAIGDYVELSLHGTLSSSATMLFDLEDSITVNAQYDNCAKYPEVNLVNIPENDIHHKDSDKISVPGNPSMALNLKSTTKSYKPGDSVNYVLTVSNTGDCKLYGIILKDVLDNSYLELVDANGNTFNTANTNKALQTTNGNTTIISQRDNTTVLLNDLNAGDSIDLSFSVKLKSTASGKFRLGNKILAKASYEVEKGKYDYIGVVSSETAINVIGYPSAAIALIANKTVGKTLDSATGRYNGNVKKNASYENGEEINYAITVTNTGTTDLYNLKISDLLSDKLVSVLDNDYGFSLPDTGELTSAKGNKIVIGSANVVYNENYKSEYANDTIDGASSETESTEASNTTAATATESTSESTTTANTSTDAASTAASTDSLLSDVFSDSSNDNVINIGNSETSSLSSDSANDPYTVQIITNTEITTDVSSEVITDVSERTMGITLAKLPVNDSVVLHFVGKVKADASNAGDILNTVSLTSEYLSESETLAQVTATDAAKDYLKDTEKVDIVSATSLRIAKIADKTKDVVLKDGRYDGTKKYGEYGLGSTVKYTITVTNLGTLPATNILVTEEPSDQLKELSNYGKFVSSDTFKTVKGNTANVSIDGITAIIDKLESNDSINLEFDVKLKDDCSEASEIENVVSVSGNVTVNGDEIVIATTDLMTDSDKISINSKVKASGNEDSSTSDNSKGSEAGTDDNSKNGTNKSTKAGKTGDNNKIGLFIILFIFGTTGLITLFVFRRKNK